MREEEEDARSASILERLKKEALAGWLESGKTSIAKAMLLNKILVDQEKFEREEFIVRKMIVRVMVLEKRDEEDKVIRESRELLEREVKQKEPITREDMLVDEEVYELMKDASLEPKDVKVEVFEYPFRAI